MVDAPCGASAARRQPAGLQLLVDVGVRVRVGRRA
uniref:Uncharacterized protein n=1 Tax=Arundo donax TaxID=35708 RepID=A0A0A9BIU5_ARUDO